MGSDFTFSNFSFLCGAGICCCTASLERVGHGDAHFALAEQQKGIRTSPDGGKGGGNSVSVS